MTSFLLASSETLKPKESSGYTLADIVQIGCLSTACVWAVSPPLFVDSLARVVAALAVALWFGIEILKHPDTYLRPTWITVVVVVYGGYVNVASLLVDGSSDVLRNFSLNFMLFCVLVLESYRRRNLEHLKWPALFVSLSAAAWIVFTLFAMERQRNVARIIIRTSEESLDLQRMGVGGFALVYFACAIIPAFIYLVRSGEIKSKWVKYAGLALLVLCVLLVIKGGYFIALIVGSASIIASLLFVKGTPTYLLQGTLLLGFAMAASLFFAPSALSAGAALASGTMYQDKVEDSFEFLNSSQVGGSFEGRSGRYMRSFSLFLENPLVGVISVQDVGKHSQLIDNFARYGIFFGGLLPLMFILIGKALNDRFRQTAAAPMVVVTLTLGLSLALLNNVAATLGIALFIIMPAVGDIIAKAEKAFLEEGTGA